VTLGNVEFPSSSSGTTRIVTVLYEFNGQQIISHHTLPLQYLARLFFLSYSRVLETTHINTVTRLCLVLELWFSRYSDVITGINT
jgi:hypothetical protein